MHVFLILFLSLCFYSALVVQFVQNYFVEEYDPTYECAHGTPHAHPHTHQMHTHTNTLSICSIENSYYKQAIIDNDTTVLDILVIPFRSSRGLPLNSPLILGHCRTTGIFSHAWRSELCVVCVVCVMCSSVAGSHYITHCINVRAFSLCSTYVRGMCSLWFSQ